MNYFIFVLLLAGIQSLNPKMLFCVAISTNSEKEGIISNIRNQIPQNNNAKINEILAKALICAAGSIKSNNITKHDFYRAIYRIIFKNERDLTVIHKEYCNHGKDNGIKKCFSTLGESYPCANLMDSFGPCVNDANYDDAL